MTDYFDPSGVPSEGSQGDSGLIRSELIAVQQGISSKLPPLGGNGNNVCVINAGGTSLTSITLAALKTALNIDEPTSGSFSTNVSGFTTAESSTIQWYRSGDIVTLRLDTGVIGTSNSGIITMDGLPSELSPTEEVICVASGVANDSVLGVLSVSRIFGGASSIVVYPVGYDGTNVRWDSSGGFASSGAKAIYSTWSITYAVN